MANIVLSDRLIEIRRSLHFAMELIETKNFSMADQFLHTVDRQIGVLLEETSGVSPQSILVLLIVENLLDDLDRPRSQRTDKALRFLFDPTHNPRAPQQSMRRDC